MDKSHSIEGQGLLQELRRWPHKRILSTNPEILYLLLPTNLVRLPNC